MKIGILLGTVVTTSSFATNAFNTILFAKNHLPKTQIQNNVTTNSITNTTDFSGNWEGSCSYIDGPVQIEIEQSDDYITIGDENFKFGAMRMTASSDTDSYDNTQMRITWDTAKTTLTLNATNINTGNSEKTIFTTISEVSMALNNDQLVMKVKANFYDNLDTMHEPVIGNCSFTKAQ